MLGKVIYKIWSPLGAKWMEWVRPVPFVGINNNFKTYENSNIPIPDINYIPNYIKDSAKNKSTALIIDLPGIDSIKEGLAVAKIGFRPIPIYNGTDEQPGAMATVDNQSIKLGLIKGAIELKKMQISNDAPPAFLLDSNRMNRYKMDESVFDNSWDIYHQDMPSAEYFLNSEINQIIVIGEKIQTDLAKILYKYQQKGIKIFLTEGYNEPKEVKVKKPKRENEDF